MEYIEYEKTLMILEEENHSFAMDEDKKIEGVIKIETGNLKGSIKTEILNILSSKIYEYKLIFFGKKRGRTIYTVIGDICISEEGIGEGYFRFDPGNMDGKGSELGEYTMAVIAAASLNDSKEPLHPVMKCYCDDRVKEKGQVRAEKSEKGTYSGYYKEYLILCCEKLKENMMFYENIVPFKKDRLNCTWKKIANTGKMPILSPQGAALCAKYRHFIFGDTPRYSYIGVPGRRIESEYPEKGRSGFSLWQPVVGAEEIVEEKEAYGYWIAAINKNNGEIEEI